MTTNVKRVTRNIIKDKLLDRELDFLPANIDRDNVREVARRYSPRRKRSAPLRFMVSTADVLARYSAPFVGLLAGAEYAAAKALYPLMGQEERYGDSLRLYLGEDLGQKMADMGRAFEVTGTLVAATPKIVVCALYGALAGIGVYYVAKWILILGVFSRRRLKLRRKVSELLA